MDAARRRMLIERYKDGYRAVRDGVDQRSAGELDVAAEGSDWTPRQIAHHLADSETMSGIRLRRLLAEDQPVIEGYDENAFARLLHYDRPIGASLEVLRAVRMASAELLERLSEAEWTRGGTHSESGAYSVETWLVIYAAHTPSMPSRCCAVARVLRPTPVPEH
jgi:DinB family protein